MAKSKKEKQNPPATPSSLFAAKVDSVDPALASLFAASSGPVKIPKKKPQPAPEHVAGDETLLESESEAAKNGDTHAEAKEDVSAPIVDDGERPRKRKRAKELDDLEEKYFERLEREEEKERQQKKPRQGHETHQSSSDHDSLHSDLEDISDEDTVPALEDMPRHETLIQQSADESRISRTVFLGNVSTEAIKSKAARRILEKHLQSALKESKDGETPEKLESVRFRSTAYASGSGPKKATFAKKELMDETTVSTNAYAVFTTENAAKRVAKKLNGTIVLDRHLRADYLGQPSTTDHKRCVFIGNLTFVNQEGVTQDQDDEQQRRPRAKEPADAEEGLWRTFGKVGKVESVRVVRDQETRVSKGFAYVQFESENSVEAALLLNEKRFPPMLPRKLRVMRAKKTKQSKSTRVNAHDKSKAHTKSGSFADKRKSLGGADKKSAFVFEGHRANSSAKFALTRKKHKKRPNTRSSRRGATFKAAGGKKQKRQG
ncbi:hypothetical protein PV08_00536 [Exophiala spinifera]|uniref:Nucleolar protein 12 n=1 Tax=Exophiala spinifera TaxID=91928 RepID=A0A0D1YXH0_9EURO|nr:uncharacterized protein PV08_00536 [Exophiala spinifera]KIW19961.1 hypothetical protein PV08_00536 [Exophiala spinifera]